jgi:hypothetical protein
VLHLDDFQSQSFGFEVQVGDAEMMRGRYARCASERERKLRKERKRGRRREGNL